MFKRIIIVLVAALAVLGCDVQTNTKYVDRTHTITLEGAPTGVSFRAEVYAAGNTATPIGGGAAGSVTQPNYPAVIPVQPYNNGSFDAPPYRIMIAAGSGADGILKYKDSVSLSGSISKLTWGDMTEITAAASGISLLNGDNEPISIHVFTPVSDSLTVTIRNDSNQATGDLTVTISDSSKFTVTQPEPRNIETAGGKATFTVRPNTNALGVHQATVTVGNAANGITASFGVIFTVNDPATPSYSIMLSEVDTCTFVDNEGYGDISKTITISNTGNQYTGDLKVSLGAANSNFVIVTEDGENGEIDSIPEGEIATFTVSPKPGLKVKNTPYTDTVTVSAASGNTTGIKSKSFDVSFTVSGTPSYGIGLSVSGTLYFPPVFQEETVTITNIGTSPTGPLTVSLTNGDTDAFDIVITKPTTGAIADIPKTGNAKFTISPNSGLDPGTYTATVTVGPADGNNNLTEADKKSFNVSFTVGPVEYGIVLSNEGTYRFATEVVGYAGPITPETFYIYNTGTSPTGPLAVSLTTTLPNGTSIAGTTAAFTWSQPHLTDGIGTQPGASASFTITPQTGLEVGIYTAEVKVGRPADDDEEADEFNKYFTVSFEVVGQYLGLQLVDIISNDSKKKVDTDINGVYLFKTAYKDDDPESYVVTFRNMGNVPIHGLSANIPINGETDFGIGDITTAGLLEEGGVCQFTITPIKKTVASYTAAIKVSGNFGTPGTPITPISFDVSYKVIAPFTTVTGTGSALKYLEDHTDGDTVDNPVLLKMGAIAAQTALNGILSGLGATPPTTQTKFVDLDLSLCTGDLNLASENNIAITNGKAKIVSLILPAVNVTNAGTPTDQSPYNKLATISGKGNTVIGQNAFLNFPELTKADFPDTTAPIGEAAFQGCEKLADVNFPKVTAIGKSAFHGCTALVGWPLPGETEPTTLSFPAAIGIGNNAFQECTSLKKVYAINVTDIGNNAFQKCTSLTTASFPAVTSIGSSAFASTSTSDINVPLTISMGTNAPITLGTNIFHNVTVAKTVFIKVNNGATGYNPAWIKAFKGMGNTIDETLVNNYIAVNVDYY
jgi:hypothetical protein